MCHFIFSTPQNTKVLQVVKHHRLNNSNNNSSSSRLSWAFGKLKNRAWTAAHSSAHNFSPSILLYHIRLESQTVWWVPLFVLLFMLPPCHFLLYSSNTIVTLTEETNRSSHSDTFMCAKLRTYKLLLLMDNRAYFALNPGGTSSL